METHARRIVWLLNLDADRELRAPKRYRPNDRLRALRDRSSHFADLVGPDDLVLDPALPQSCELRPEAYAAQAFCPTPSARARLAALGYVAPTAPGLAILRRVNDRAFCAELGQSLACACFVRDMPALERQLAQESPTGRYVIKRAFSFAGREQRRIEGRVLDDSTRGFCRRSFARGEGLQIEPWVERLADFSRHAYLVESGALLTGPTREQRCDAFGRFLGMSTAAAQVTDDEAQQLADALQRTAAALTAAGYYGPFGIDGFRYRSPDGSTAFNPRCEINARFTMGYPRGLLLDALARS